MGNKLSKCEQAVKKACEDVNLDAFQKALASSSPSDPCDVFKILISDSTAKPEKKSDFVTTLFHSECERTGSWGEKRDLLPFLKLFLIEVEKNNAIIAKTNNSKVKFTSPQIAELDGGYLEHLVRSQNFSIECFRFLLDNANVFPLFTQTSAADDDCPPSILHDLCGGYKIDERLPLLQELIRSGQVPTVFKNNNDKNNNNDRKLKTMRHPKYRNTTPVQYACSYMNLDAVRELCAAGIGGTNFGDALTTMFREAWVPFDEEKVVEIFKILIAQPDSEVVLRNVKLPITTTTPVPTQESQQERIFTECVKDKFDVSFLCDTLGIEDFAGVFHDNIQISPALAAFALQHATLFATLHSHGFKVFTGDDGSDGGTVINLTQEDRTQACRAFWEKCCDIENSAATDALVTWKLHDWLINDVNAAFVWEGCLDNPSLSSAFFQASSSSPATPGIDDDDDNKDEKRIFENVPTDECDFIVDPRTQLKFIDIPSPFDEVFNELTGVILHFFSRASKLTTTLTTNHPQTNKKADSSDDNNNNNDNDDDNRKRNVIILCSDRVLYQCNTAGHINRCVPVVDVREVRIDRDFNVALLIDREVEDEYDMAFCLDNMESCDELANVIQKTSTFLLRGGPSPPPAKITHVAECITTSTATEDLRLTKPPGWQFRLHPFAPRTGLFNAIQNLLRSKALENAKPMSALEVIDCLINKAAARPAVDRKTDYLISLRLLLIDAGAKDEEKAKIEEAVERMISGQIDLPSQVENLRKFCFQIAIRGYVSALSKFLNVCLEKDRLKSLFESYHFYETQNGSSDYKEQQDNNNNNSEHKLSPCALFFDVLRFGADKSDVIELMLKTIRENFGDEYLKTKYLGDDNWYGGLPLLESACASPRLSYETLSMVVDCVQQVSDGGDLLKKTFEATGKWIGYGAFDRLCLRLSNFKRPESAIASLKLLFGVARTIGGDEYFQKTSSSPEDEDDRLRPTLFAASLLQIRGDSRELVVGLADVFYSAGVFQSQYEHLFEKPKAILYRHGIDEDFKGVASLSTSLLQPKRNQTTSNNTKEDTNNSSSSLVSLQQMFNQFDYNGDGVLSRAEIMPMMMHFFKNASPAEIQAKVRAADTNSDGMLSFDEFVKLVNSIKVEHDEDDDFL